MRDRTAPDHRDPEAFDGLRRRLARRAQSAIDTAQAAGDYGAAEEAASRFHAWRTADVAARRDAAKRSAAAVAGVALLDRIGRAPSR